MLMLLLTQQVLNKRYNMFKKKWKLKYLLNRKNKKKKIKKREISKNKNKKIRANK